MPERRCSVCGSYIVINGKNVEIHNTPAAPVSNVTCKQCKEWIVANIG